MLLQFAESKRCLNHNSRILSLVFLVISGLLHGSMLIAALILVAVLRWRQFGSFVPGVDAGNWLALGAGFLGQDGRTAEVVYPPLVPSLFFILQESVDPMTAAKIVGIGSLVAVMASTYVVAKLALHQLIATSMALMVGLSIAITESVIIGSYPQQYAFASLLLASYSQGRYLSNGSNRYLMGTFAALLVSALSHHMYFVLTCFEMLLVWALWTSTRPGRPLVIERTRRTLVVSLLALMWFLPVVYALFDAGFDPPLRNADLNPESALKYGIREAPWVWVPIIVSSCTFLLLTYRRRSVVSYQVAAASILVATVTMAFTGQPRLLAPLIVGTCLGLGLLFQDIWENSRDTVWRGITLIIPPLIPLVMIFSRHYDASMEELIEQYRVVDHSLMETARFIDMNYSDSVVAVRQDRAGHPIGWWFEGLTGASIVVGSPPEQLTFPDEHAQARVADDLFNGQSTSLQVRDIAGRAGVELLVFRKWEWLGWQRWLEESAPAVVVVYDDGNFMVVDVSQRSSRIGSDC